MSFERYLFELGVLLVCVFFLGVIVGAALMA